jgi:hypothetical protein
LQRANEHARNHLSGVKAAPRFSILPRTARKCRVADRLAKRDLDEAALGSLTPDVLAEPADAVVGGLGAGLELERASLDSAMRAPPAPGPPTSIVIGPRSN